MKTSSFSQAFLEQLCNSNPSSLPQDLWMVDFQWSSKWIGLLPSKKGFLKRYLGHWIKSPGRKAVGPENPRLRSSPRIPVQKKVEAYPLRPQTAFQPFSGNIRNINKTGLCLETPEPLSTSHVILLNFSIRGIKKFQTPAKVVWAKDKISGLEFLDPDGTQEFMSSLGK